MTNKNTNNLLNTIINGDCIEEMKQIPDGSIDLILTDLPYGTTALKWDTVIDFTALWYEYERVIKDNGAILLFAVQPFTTQLINSNPKLYKYIWYWEKNTATGFQYSRYQPMRKIEEVVVFYKKAPYFDNEGEPFDKPDKRKYNGTREVHGIKIDANYERVSTHRRKTNVLKFKKPIQKDNLHPTQKPVDLLEYLIKTYTLEGDTVLDSTAGSSSTAIAAINTNRNFIMIEKDKEYFNIGAKRIGERYGIKDYQIPEDTKKIKYIF